MGHEATAFLHIPHPAMDPPHISVAGSRHGQIGRKPPGLRLQVCFQPPFIATLRAVHNRLRQTNGLEVHNNTLFIPTTARQLSAMCCPSPLKNLLPNSQ